MVEALHQALFRRKGGATTRKKAVLEFSGFPAGGDAEAAAKEAASREASLSKIKLDTLHRVLDALDLPRGGGDKAGKVGRLLAFLAAPTAAEGAGDLAAKEAAKKEKERAKKERLRAKKERAAAKRAKAAAKKAKAAAGGGAKKRAAGGGAAGGSPAKKAKKAAGEEAAEASGASSSEEEEEASGSSSSEEEEETMPAKKVRGERAADAPTPAKPAAKTPAKAAKAPTPAPKKTPAAKKAPAAPAAEAAAPAAAAEVPAPAAEGPAADVPAAQIVADVRELLSAMGEAELAAMTVKGLLAALADKYGFELKARKAEVRAAAAAFIEERAAAA